MISTRSLKLQSRKKPQEDNFQHLLVEAEHVPQSQLYQAFIDMAEKYEEVVDTLHEKEGEIEAACIVIDETADELHRANEIIAMHKIYDQRSTEIVQKVATNTTNNTNCSERRLQLQQRMLDKSLEIYRRRAQMRSRLTKD